MSVKRAIALSFLGIFGILLFAAGIGLLASMDKIMLAIQRKINDSMPLTTGSQSYNNWMDPPVPVYMQFWLFDVQNPEDVVKHGAKPIVREKGPYTYREVRPRENVTFLNESLLSYTQPKSYVFVPEMSAGSENDTFISVNIPILTAATMVQYRSSILQLLIRSVLSTVGEHLFQNYTVYGFLWGAEEKTLKKLNDIALKYLGWKLFKDDKFGLFYGPTGNGTTDGVYVINTGVDDLDDINDIDTWNDNRTLPYWRSEYCNMINGTDGTMWHPDVKMSDTLYLFSSDICRSIYIQYKNNVTVEGIPLYHFVPPEEVLADHITNPDNAGFCTPNCLGSGVLNVSNCKANAPIIVSQPHFYQGDQKYIDAIEGLHPSEQHETFIDIEPMTGVAMKVAKRLQINIFVKKLEAFRDTSGVNDTVFPLLWLNESASITKRSAGDFKRQILMPKQVIYTLQYVLTALGALLILVLLVIIIVPLVRNRLNKGEPTYGVLENEAVDT